MPYPLVLLIGAAIGTVALGVHVYDIYEDSIKDEDFPPPEEDSYYLRGQATFIDNLENHSAIQSSDSIYNRIGGDVAIASVVDAFYDRVLVDAMLKPFFATVISKDEGKMRRFMAAALGGPVQYKGKDMETANRNLNISNIHFDAVIGHLVDSMRY
jgi:hemoglobin